MKTSELRKKWACDYQKLLQKSYEKTKDEVMQNCKTYEKLTTTLQVP